MFLRMVFFCLTKIAFQSTIGLLPLASYSVAQDVSWKLQSAMSNSVNALRCEISPNSKTIAVSCSDDSVRLSDLTTGVETVRLVGHKNDVTDISCSPNGKRLVTCANQEYPLGGFRVWSSITGECLYTQDTFLNQPSCRAVAYRPDGKSFVAETYDRLPTGIGASWSVDEFDARTFRPIRQIVDLTQNANSLAFSKNGGLLLVGDAGSVNHHSRLIELTANSQHPQVAQFAPDAAEFVIAELTP